MQARPELFQPEQPVVLSRQPSALEPAAPALEINEHKPAPTAPQEEKPVSTTSRLLDAKRRAQKKRE
jgi:hypothetical protein